jgi:AcrR family transcriptional regulator
MTARGRQRRRHHHRRRDPEAGVSSGSVYHRFPDRAALVAAVWNRAVQRFHVELSELSPMSPWPRRRLSGPGPCLGARANPADARVLLAGLGSFEPAAWLAEGRSRREADQARWDEHIRRLVTGLKTVTGRQTAEIPATLEGIVERLIHSQLESAAPR